jgi:hypothetical protein
MSTDLARRTLIQIQRSARRRLARQRAGVGANPSSDGTKTNVLCN